MVDKNKISKIAILLTVVALFTACIGTQIASAGYLVKQYHIWFLNASPNPQYSEFFTANSGVVSVTGWQTSDSATPTVGYSIARYYLGIYQIVSNMQPVEGNFSSSKWFPALNFTNIPPSNTLALRTTCNTSYTTLSGNIYDGW